MLFDYFGWLLNREGTPPNWADVEMRNFMRIIDNLRQHGFDIEVLRNLISNVSFGRIAWSVAGDFSDIENPTQIELNAVFQREYPPIPDPITEEPTPQTPENGDVIINTGFYNDMWMSDGTIWHDLNTANRAKPNTKNKGVVLASDGDGGFMPSGVVNEREHSDGHIAQSGFNNKWVANWVSGGSGAGNVGDRIRMRFEEGYSGGGGQSFVFDFDTTFGLLFQTIASAGNINNRTRLSHRGLNVANGDESGVGLGWNEETVYNAGGVFQNRISDGALLFNLTNLGLYFYQTTRTSNDKYELIRFGADHGSEISCNGANRLADHEVFRIAKRNPSGDLLGKALTVENPVDVAEFFSLRSPQNRQIVQGLTILHEDEIVLYGFAERMYAKKIDAISNIIAGNGISVSITGNTDGTRSATITNTQTGGGGGSAVQCWQGSLLNQNGQVSTMFRVGCGTHNDVGSQSIMHPMPIVPRGSLPATLSMNVRAYSRALSGGTISISRIRGGTITDNVGAGLTFGALGNANTYLNTWTINGHQSGDGYYVNIAPAGAMAIGANFSIDVEIRGV
jgi:hypothetical protein